MREAKNRKSNSGFTLVEVLIAVAILSVVSIPIIQSFVSVAQVNAKSRRRMSATTIAENLMESCKGTSLLEVGAQCNQLAKMTIVSGDSYVEGATTAQELNTSETPFTTSGSFQKTVEYSNGYKFNKPESVCAFYIHKIMAGGASYDAVITYRYDSTRTYNNAANEDIVNMADSGVHVMSFYTVTVDVYRSASGYDYLADVLASISGSVADYSE